MAFAVYSHQTQILCTFVAEAAVAEAIQRGYCQCFQMDWYFAVIVRSGWENLAAKKGMDYCFAVAAVRFEQETPAAE